MDVKIYLCYYDKRNPEGIMDDEDIQSHNESIAKRSKKLNKEVRCACDNCFYERHKLAEYALELETKIKEKL